MEKFIPKVKVNFRKNLERIWTQFNSQYKKRDGIPIAPWQTKKSGAMTPDQLIISDQKVEVWITWLFSNKEGVLSETLNSSDIQRLEYD